ncbi:hypothetical protein ACO2JO_18730 [Leptospira interrogans]
MDIIYWLLIIVLLVVLALAGVLRPTGLAGRTHAQNKEDRNRSIVGRWLKKQDRK